MLGLPKNMNATEGERAELTREFKAGLERRTGLPVTMWDERLTTVAADRAMMEAGIDILGEQFFHNLVALHFHDQAARALVAGYICGVPAHDITHG